MGIDAVDYSFGNFANSLGAYNSANYLASSALSNIGSNAALCAYNPLSMGCGLLGFNGGGYDPFTYTKQMNDMNNLIATNNLDAQYNLGEHNKDLQLTANANDLRRQAKDNKIKDAVGVLSRLMEENKQDEVPDAIKKVEDAVADKLKDVGVYTNDPKILDPYVKQYFLQYTKKDFDTASRENGDSQFWAGCKKGVLFGLGGIFMSKKTAIDTRNNMDGTLKTNADKAQEFAGRVTSGVVTGIAALFAAILIFKGTKEGAVALGKGLRWAWTG